MDSAKVPIRVCMQTVQSLPDGGTDRQQLDQIGTGWFVVDQWIIRFTEKSDDTGQIQTTIKAKSSDLIVMRQGEVTMRQQFVPQRGTRSTYYHPYGAIEMDTFTDRIIYRETLDGWHISWHYRLRLNGTDAGTFTIQVTAHRLERSGMT